MSAPVTVSREWLDRWTEYCQRMGIRGPEERGLRDAVRADFARAGGWIWETVAVLRWIDRTWDGYATPERCKGYLASRGIFPPDDIFERWGILLLARECALADGPLP